MGLPVTCFNCGILRSCGLIFKPSWGRKPWITLYPVYGARLPVYSRTRRRKTQQSCQGCQGPNVWCETTLYMYSIQDRIYEFVSRQSYSRVFTAPNSWISIAKTVENNKLAPPFMNLISYSLNCNAHAVLFSIMLVVINRVLSTHADIYIDRLLDQWSCLHEWNSSILRLLYLPVYYHHQLLSLQRH